MTPNVGDEKLLSGFANCGWLRALKNSARNSSVVLSRSQGSTCVLETARSTFAWPGPVTNPVELLPNAVAGELLRESRFYR
jgi:hypothetical protein